ncbi:MULTISPECIES: hypothetical protein [unclassified Lysobacter]
MRTIKTYPTRLEADLAKIALATFGIPAIVAGIGVSLEGGSAGMKLLVPDDCVGAAMTVLDDA